MADKPKDKLKTKEKKVGRGEKMKGSRQNQDLIKRTTKMENPELLGSLQEEEGATSDPLREKLQMREKKVNKLPADENLGARSKKTTGRIKESDGTGLSLDEHNEDFSLKAVTKENTYQLGPTKRFPVSDATNILMEVLSSSLKEEKYELHRAQELSLTLSSVIRERVKALRIPRYKIVVLVTIGQVKGQGIQISSRCLWDATCDTFTSYTFRNSSLFATASVFAVYFE